MAPGTVDDIVSRLRLDVTVRPDGVHLVVRGGLDGTSDHRLRRALLMLEHSPRGGTIDLAGVERVTPGALSPLLDTARLTRPPHIVVTDLSPALVDALGQLGLPTGTPLHLTDWGTP